MNDDRLAAALTAVARSVDGVAVVYPARSALQHAADDITATVTGRTPAAEIAVSRSDDGIEIRGRIGVESGARAPEVVRRVAEAVQAETRRMLDADVRVNVHIQASSIG